MTLPSAWGPVALAWTTLIGEPPLTTTVSGPELLNPAMKPICWPSPSVKFGAESVCELAVPAEVPAHE
jgi:hypothetical protein